nr:MAG TPA: Stage V sporulation protein T, Activator, DNA-binding, Repressor, Sporulation [Caudoviricetes sp.]
MAYNPKKMIRKVRDNNKSSFLSIPTYIRIKMDISKGDWVEFKESKDGKIYIEKVDNIE